MITESHIEREGRREKRKKKRRGKGKEKKDKFRPVGQHLADNEEACDIQKELD